MASASHNNFRTSLGSLIGVSIPMQRVYASIQRASTHRYPVLALGETGSGKELVARSVHSSSFSPSRFSGPRAEQPFVSLDCGTLAPTFTEAELFGFAKGAFVGTPEAKTGLLGLAEGGTLLLHEVTALPLGLQTKLFQVLHTREFSPVGSKEKFAFRARVMATSELDLAELVRRGAFREDLYFCLSVAQIELPPLRSRRVDIPLLASHFIESYSVRLESPRNISDAAMECLLSYSWPGNVLELERAIRWALSFASGPVIELDDLPPNIRASGTSKHRDPAAHLPTIQNDYISIINALNATGGDRTAAARLLRIGESAFDRKLQVYGF